jgi:hypothetical protein
MGLYQVAAILGFNSAIAAVAGLIRLRKIDPAYQPFIIIVVIGFLNHSLSLTMVYYFGSNAVNGNFFVIIEALLYVWQFSNWGLFKKRKQTAFLLGALLLAAWIIDNLVLNSIFVPNSGFRIFSSFIMVFLAIGQLTTMINKAKINLLKSAIFVICSGMLIYFSYKAFIEVFFLVKWERGSKLIYNIYAIFIGINFLVNFLFAWAVLWVPKKKTFIH